MDLKSGAEKLAKMIIKQHEQKDQMKVLKAAEKNLQQKIRETKIEIDNTYNKIVDAHREQH